MIIRRLRLCRLSDVDFARVRILGLSPPASSRKCGPKNANILVDQMAKKRRISGTAAHISESRINCVAIWPLVLLKAGEKFDSVFTQSLFLN